MDELRKNYVIEWAKFESRIRHLMHQVLEPTQHSYESIRFTVNTTYKKRFDKMAKTIEEQALEMKLINDRIETVDDFKKQLKLLEDKNHNRLKAFEQKSDKLNQILINLDGKISDTKD